MPGRRMLTPCGFGLTPGHVVQMALVFVAGGFTPAPLTVLLLQASLFVCAWYLYLCVWVRMRVCVVIVFARLRLFVSRE